MVALYHCIVYALTPGAVYKIAKYAHQLTVIGILKTLPGKFTVFGFGCDKW